jgi:anti-sigma regulatory factor (Ser/Thr protein kinase)
MNRSAETPPPRMGGVSAPLRDGGRLGVYPSSVSHRTELTLRLRATVDSVRTARHAVDGFAPLTHYPDAAFRVRLLITELVANSVRHAGLATSDRIGLGIDANGVVVRVEVRDGGAGFQPPSQFNGPPEGTSGRGLYLVDALADRWGVERGDADTMVWFEVDL